MRRLIPSALISLVLLAFAQAPVHAWGYTAHKFIMDRAIALLPSEIRPFYEKYRTAIVEHAIDPDTYKIVGWADESPRHFLDMDSYGSFPFASIPHDYDEAVAKRGVEFVVKNGTLPWRTQEIYNQLRDSFRSLPTAPYARDNVKLFSSVIAHYLGDATQPLHAVANYDGQLTGQSGIHARFEADLFERYENRLKIAPGPVVPIANVRDFTFATLADSFQNVQPILDADRAAVAGREVYDDDYFERLFEKTEPILEARVSKAITDVASVIAAAWIDAGRPALPADAPPRPPRKVRKPAAASTD
jgi:hypothetical protein